MINVPKELNPKAKVSILEVKSIMYMIIYIGIFLEVSNLLNIDQGINWVINSFIIITGIMFLFSSKKYGSTYKLLSTSIKYQVGKKNKSNYFIAQDKKKEVKQVKGNKVKTKNKKVSKSKKEKEDDIFKKYKIVSIDYENNIIKTKKNHVTFLEISLKELPFYQNTEKQEWAIEDFHDILKVESKGSIFSINTQYDFTTEIEKLDTTKLKEEKFKSFLNFKKWQFKRAERFFKIKYFIEVSGEDENELQRNIYKYRNTSFNITAINGKDFKYIINQRYLNEIETEIYEDYTYSKVTNEYSSYLHLDDFESLQTPYFLDILFNTNYDISLKYKEVLDYKLTFNKATTEIESRSKYDRRRTTLIEIQNSLSYIDQLNKSILRGNEKLLKIELIIKINEKSLEALKTKRVLIKTKFKNKGYLSDSFFIQSENLFHFSKIISEENISNSYTVSSKSLAYSYPFDFIEYSQTGGSIKNVNRNSMLKLNFYSTSNSENKDDTNSYAKIYIGEPGSGKSSALKEDALEEYILLNSNVLMLDFDGETQKLIKRYDGDYIRIGTFAINPLRIIYNFKNSNNVSDHLSSVITFFNKLYDINDQQSMIIKKSLKNLYETKGITEDTLYKTNDFPTIKELYTHLKDKKINNTKDKDYTQVLDKMNDFIFSYPYYSFEDKALEITNGLTSFCFDQIKDDEKILNASLMLVMRYINFRMRFNKIDDISFKENSKKMRHYIEKYIEINGIKGLEEAGFYNLGLEDQIDYLNKNKRFFRIIIDEAHRVFKNKEAIKMLDPLVRDSRKYYAGLTFADHSVKLLLSIDPSVSIIFDIIPYKILLKADRINADVLKSELKLSEQHIQNLLNPKEKGSGLICFNGKVFEYHSPLNQEIIRVFDGGK